MIPETDGVEARVNSECTRAGWGNLLLRNATQAATIFNRDNESRARLSAAFIQPYTSPGVHVQFANGDNGGARRRIKGELRKRR